MDQAGGARDYIPDVPAAAAPDVGDRGLNGPSWGGWVPGSLARTLSHARFNRRELAGSLGDMGTFLPLLLGMVRENGLSFVSALFFAGVFSIITGLLFTIPMAVQPMKAIAAVAIAEKLTVPQIMAAGAIVSAVVLILGLTGAIGTVARWIPRSIVRGIQLSLGLTLLMKGVGMVVGPKPVFDAQRWDSYALAAGAAVVVLLLASSKRIPAAIVLFIAGLGIAIWQTPGAVRELGLGIWLPAWSPPALGDFVGPALTRAALPQAPLTMLNSVVAVCALSGDLFPQRRAGERSVAVSVGLMNLVGAWFGAMPMCHGAGGLAGHYRFGARTNGANFFLGTVLIGAAVFLGPTLLTALVAFPASILGVMLMFSGLELGLVVRDQTRREDVLIMLLTAGVALGMNNNVAIGLLAGLATFLLLRTFRTNEAEA